MVMSCSMLCLKKSDQWLNLIGLKIVVGRIVFLVWMGSFGFSWTVMGLKGFGKYDGGSIEYKMVGLFKVELSLIKLWWVWRCKAGSLSSKKGGVVTSDEASPPPSPPFLLPLWVALWEFFKLVLSLTCHLSPTLTIHSSNIWFWKEWN